MSSMIIEYPNGTYAFPPMGGLSYCNENSKIRPPEYVYYVVVQDKEDGHYMIVESGVKDSYLPITAHATMELAERALLKLSNK